MKKIVSIIIIVLVSLNLNAQEKTTEKDSIKKNSIDSSKVKTLESTIKTLYDVISGEKGVGKSTFAMNFALALKIIGLKVGILDADIYGQEIEVILLQKIRDNQKWWF